MHDTVQVKCIDLYSWQDDVTDTLIVQQEIHKLVHVAELQFSVPVHHLQFAVVVVERLQVVEHLQKVANET